MNSHDFPLVVFTLCQQFAIGTFLLTGLLLLKQRITGIYELTVSRRFFWILGLMAIGLLASTFHLGQPLRGINAFNRLGEAWLSNEVFITGLFIASGGLFWLLALCKPDMIQRRRLFLVITMLLGLGLLAAMSKLYMMETIPSWNNCYTPLSFVASTILGGALLSHLMITGTQYSACARAMLNGVGITALVCALIVALLQTIYLTGVSSSITTAIGQVSDYHTYLYLRVLLELLAFVIWITMIIKGKYCTVSTLMILMLVIIAESLGRGVFYATHMTVGL